MVKFTIFIAAASAVFTSGLFVHNHNKTLGYILMGAGLLLVFYAVYVGVIRQS